MISLADLNSSQQLIDDLAWPFDFDLQAVDEDLSWLRIVPALPIQVIAGDGAGGIFARYGVSQFDELPILYVTSEGQAGRVASNLSEFLAVILAAPYWQDLLKFSGNGLLEEMRKTRVFVENDLAEDYPELPTARLRIESTLAIPQIEDPVRTLHDAVHATDVTVFSEEGLEFDTLFNSFTSEDNPNWK